jgi:hypothetical protein
MDENSKDSNKNGAWWRPIMFFYVKTTSWIVFPLVLAVFSGKYVGESFGSQSLFFLFVILGFLITCLGIYREIKKYKKSLDLNKNSIISAPSPSEKIGKGTHDA